MKTLEKLKKNIEEEKISPKSKLQFLYKEWFIWGVGATSVIFGGVSFAATLFVFKNTQWAMRNITHDSLFNFILEYFPFVWLVFFAVFLVAAYLFFRHTKKGYKYNFIIVVAGVLVLTFMFGLISFSFGFGAAADKGFGKRVPFYKDIEMREQNYWQRPSEGLFVGAVLKTEFEYILDHNEKDFVILSENLPEHFEFILDNSDKVKIIGVLKGESNIYPCAIFPFEIEERKLFGGEKIKPKNEIKFDEERINNCKDVRPYKKLKLIQKPPRL